ncbi:7559_t:CDS:2 [Dentiscutata erythropus]|uniref:7559_t:CDS:1 n=1 Tax=Dentiscutata erythropus TaxID=1348616 RepID=A0A9N9C9U9_9GLOM|nr:7559_t:CDS:2 [Dentiscutata erythropus]
MNGKYTSIESIQKAEIIFDFKNKDEAVQLFSKLLQRCRDLENENEKLIEASINKLRQEFTAILTGFDFPHDLIEDAKGYLKTTNKISTYRSETTTFNGDLIKSETTTTNKSEVTTNESALK